MSYAGMGSAQPRYVSYGRLRADSFDRWRRRGGLGAAAPTTTNPDGAAGTAALLAAGAVIAYPTQVRNHQPIPQVRDFQAAYGHGLTVDGIYGPATRAALVTATGRVDLPAAPSSGGSSSSSSYVAPTTVDPTMVDPSTSTSSSPSWLVPVAVVSALVLVAGGLMYKRRPVRANRRRHRRSR